ncbi:MAG: nitrogenase component 1, partial [Pseudomonadales bacterium]
GPMSLGFRHRDDLEEVRSLLDALGIRVNAVAPLGADPEAITHLGDAHFNIVLYPELARPAGEWLRRRFGQPMVETVPLGVSATREFIAEVAACAGVDPAPALALERRLRMPWYSLSVDSNYLTDKRVFIFGDGTHALAAARIAKEEMGFEVVGLGSYSRVMARPLRAAAEALGLEALITDDYLEVEAAIEAAAPELILGTQMERHIAKRLGIGCAVISAPVHVQDFPARYAPQMGYEGANVIFDSWIHPLTMGLEEHLLGMFSEDFEFSNDAAPSHLGHASQSGSHLSAVPSPAPSLRAAKAMAPEAAGPREGGESSLSWAPQAEAELKKIPFFVRKKARRNTEQFALDHGLGEITVETLYDAKAHFAR